MHAAREFYWMSIEALHYCSAAHTKWAHQHSWPCDYLEYLAPRDADGRLELMVDVDHILLEAVRRRFGVVHRPVVALDAWRSGRGWLAAPACESIDTQLNARLSSDNMEMVLRGMHLRHASCDWLQTRGGTVAISCMQTSSGSLLPTVSVSVVTRLCSCWSSRK